MSVAGIGRFGSVFVVFSVISACQSTAIAPEAFSNSVVGAHGYIVGSFAVTCSQNRSLVEYEGCAQGFRQIDLVFLSRNGTSSGALSSWAGMANNTRQDFVKADEKGHFFCLALSPGEYYFNSTSYVLGLPLHKDFYLKDEEKFDLPFSVKADRITNLGGLKVTTVEQGAILGTHDHLPGRVEIGRRGDVEKALLKCPAQATGFPIDEANLRAGVRKSSKVLAVVPELP